MSNDVHITLNNFWAKILSGALASAVVAIGASHISMRDSVLSHEKDIKIMSVRQDRLQSDMIDQSRQIAENRQELAIIKSRSSARTKEAAWRPPLRAPRPGTPKQQVAQYALPSSRGNRG